MLVGRAGGAFGAAWRWVLGPQIDAKGQDAVFYRPDGITEHGEVLEVQLHLAQDHLPFGSFDRWQAPPADGRRPFAEALDHLARVELVAHRFDDNGAGARARERRRAKLRRARTVTWIDML